MSNGYGCAWNPWVVRIHNLTRPAPGASRCQAFHMQPLPEFLRRSEGKRNLLFLLPLFSQHLIVMGGRRNVAKVAPDRLAQSRISGRLSKPGLRSSVDEKGTKRKRDEVDLKEQVSPSIESPTNVKTSGLFSTSKRVCDVPENIAS